jgi:putative Holliday junction resolvase
MRVERVEEKGREMEEIAGERQPAKVHGRILALDVGVKRIGMAVSDELGWTAIGLETLTRGRVREDTAHIAKVASAHGAVLVLLGLPLNMDGSEGSQAEYVRDFGARLEKRHGLSVAYRDERLSSVAAEEVLAGQAGRTRTNRGDVDRVAAALILQEYLDARDAGGLR